MITSLQIFDYLKQVIENTITTLHESSELTHNYQINWFEKIAIEKEIDHIQDYYNDEQELKTIIGLIDQAEIIQDTAIPQNMYQIKTDISFMIEEKYIDDIYTILKTFIVENKVSKYSFGNETVMITIDSGWDDERMIVKGKKMYLADISINMIVLSSVVFSNDITLEVDGVELTNSSLSLANEVEMVPNLKKQIILGMIPNTSVFQISLVAFLDLTNPPILAFLRHISDASLFNQPLVVNVYLYKGTPKEIALSTNSKMFVKSSELEAQRGTVAVLKAALVTAAIL